MTDLKPEISSTEFINLLNNSLPIDFAANIYNSTNDKLHVPTVAENVCHLKLLKAFQVYKKSIIHDSVLNHFKVKTWQVFLTNAVRRFIIFMSALKKFHDIDKLVIPDYSDSSDCSTNESTRIVNASKKPISTNQLYHGPNETQIFVSGQENRHQWSKNFGSWLPPLDVIMVWHAFLLNPKSYYDCFIHNNFLQFSNLPFPLRRISDAIDNHSFKYLPNEKQQLAYEQLMKTYTTDLNDYQFAYKNFSIYSLPLLNIYCPICKQLLCDDVPWTDDANMGFSDEKFSFRKNCNLCFCGFDGTITHDELRKRQMVADLELPGTLPGIFKNFSEVISKPEKIINDPLNINELMKRLIKQEIRKNLNDFKSQSLQDFIVKYSPEILQKPSRLIFRNYLQMNLIHTTVQNGFEIWEDLVGCISRQERFVEKMNDLAWLTSPTIKESLSESCLRYTRFISLLLDPKQLGMLVPTLDIDLVWHTHQLSQYFYFNKCMEGKNIKGVLDHDDKVEETKLDISYVDTAKIYKQKFKEEYSICFCWYCISIRKKNHSKIKSFLNKNNQNIDKSPLYLNKLGLTHISLHNAIEFTSRVAGIRRKFVQGDHQGKILPWNDNTNKYAWGWYPDVYVLPPYSPIKRSCTTLYSHGGMCCTMGQSSCVIMSNHGQNVNENLGNLIGGCSGNFAAVCGGGEIDFTAGASNGIGGCGGFAGPLGI